MKGRHLRAWIVAAWATAWVAGSALAGESPGIVNRQGTSLEGLNLSFKDERGREVTLERYFRQGNRPLILALAYFECPGVCTVLLNGLVAGLKQLAVEPGRAFEVIVVSIDPKETSQLADEKKKSYVDAYGRPGTSDGWHFLTGSEAEIARLSAQIGFGFEKAVGGGFNHPAALFVLTPNGVLSSTLQGVRFSKKLLRVALLDAAGGRLGNFWDQFSAICYAYLPHVGWLDRPERWLILGLGFVALCFATCLLLLRGLRVGVRLDRPRAGKSQAA